MILMNSLYHYSDPDFYLLCVRFYVDDFVLHAQAPFSIGWCVLFSFGYWLFSPLLSVYGFLALGKTNGFGVVHFCCTWSCCIFDPSTVSPSCTIVHSSKKKCILGFGYDMNSFGNDLSLSTLHSPLHNNTGIGETLLLV